MHPRHPLLFSALLLAAALISLLAAGYSLADGPQQQITPTITPTLPIGTYAAPSEFTVTAVPAYMPEANGPDAHDILNILLLGSDTSNPANAGRTDAIMIVSLNRTTGTASLLSIPRDLFVYIPGWTMQRINTAFGYGQNNGDDQNGYALLKDTIRYNLGIAIDFYARVDFNDFRAIIDALGGVDVAVDCAIQDWRLIDPAFDPALEESWEMFTLPVGLHRLDGYNALWYARSRRTSSDFDRGRRQQDLMRAIWRRARELGLLSQLPALWGQFVDVVETDMGIEDLLGLVPLAMNIDTGHITHYTLQPNVHVTSWRTPAGSSVQLPIREALLTLVGHFMTPATENQLVQGGAVVEVVNASGYLTLDAVAADTLAWQGFVAIAAGDADTTQAQTQIYDFTGRTKGSALEALLVALHLDDDAVIVAPDPGQTVDYRVVLGWNYQTCHHNVIPPQPTATPEPSPTPGDGA